MVVRVRAPGKVVLLGEYAVLDGAPAIVAAVDRGVACAVTPSARMEVRTPTGDDRFVRAALAAVHAPPAVYTFSDWNPVPGPDKVGLGGSAAATVAAVLAGHRAAGRDPDPDEVFAVARAVHRRVQGSGSGVDVAASTYGGVLRFERDRVRAGPAVKPSVVFTGRSAQTGPRVERYLAWTPREAFVADSRALADAFEAEPIRALREAGRLLAAMAAEAGIPYVTPETEALVALAERHGGAAKPSGAGGGDVVVALFDAAEQIAAYEADAEAAGFRPIAVRLAGPAG